VHVEFDSARDLEVFTYALRSQPPSLVNDVVPTELTVMVFVADGVSVSELRTIVADCLASQRPDSSHHQLAGSEITIGVHYDGADLDYVARIHGLHTSEVINLHAGATWTCTFIGFAPGFAYLTCPSSTLDVPRRSQSRPQVPSGAVALAGRYSAIYPRSSPGGWQLIGSTDVPVWDLHACPPALLTQGTRIRFVDLGRR
jgi:KipI family sensor histidine kinase inhibitor